MYSMGVSLFEASLEFSAPRKSIATEEFGGRCWLVISNDLEWTLSRFSAVLEAKTPD